jgi:hypothetical protein
VIIKKININKDSEAEARQAVRDLVRAVHAGDAESFYDAAEAFDLFPNVWRDFMRKVAKANPSDDFRKFFLRLWLRDGDTIRLGVDDDLVLCDGLRSLLPRYAGPTLTLYRGDSARNRRRRTYGLSWSANRDTARGHAMGVWRSSEGGSVLLEAKVSSEAIISAPALLGDYYGEEEYIVDRRRLSAVKVLERFSQTSIDAPRTKGA